MYAGFWDNVGVEAVAKIDRVDVVTEPVHVSNALPAKNSRPESTVKPYAGKHCMRRTIRDRCT